MALKITCPHCGAPRRLDQPYPLPGAEVHCHRCARMLTITYPVDLVGRLRAKGVRFAGDPEPAPAHPRPSAEPSLPVPSLPEDEDGPTMHGVAPERVWPTGPPPSPVAAPTPPPAPRPSPAPPSTPPPPTDPVSSRAAAPHPLEDTQRIPARPAADRPAPAPTTPPQRRSKSWLLRGLVFLFVFALLGGLAAGGGVAGVFWYYGRDLPTVDALGRYRPPTVTVVYDNQGRLLGEIYEKRRYVVPLEEIPKVVQDAFIASEDAKFWTHSGVDYEGIVRAVGRNLSKGKKAQGASTITMQVARNFLLTNEKSYERKIREVILSRRIEEAFDKKHILFLYLNQIYLGSHSYGVEAAARSYFGKHVADLDLGEAAILAGLPQRPSDYSPHIHWEKARVRQEYVLTQMREKGFITREQEKAALDAPVDIVPETNEFLVAAPYFTEHIRRYLVDTYGFDKVYNDGLVVDSTCDLELQRVAQSAVTDGVRTSDQKVGWRGATETLDDAQIQPWLDQQEGQLREEISHRHLRLADPSVGGHDPTPERSTLEVGRVYEAVVLEVAPKHAVVGVGAHRALIPLSWTTWAYKPDASRSYKGRSLGDLTAALRKGDRVQVEVEALSSTEVDNLRGYTAAGKGPFAAVRLHQPTALQGAFLAIRLGDGAVLSMVGGTDFAGSEFNRATQSQRQVGSTFKPVVYAAAIGTRQFTAGTIVQDAPTVFATIGNKLWKPTNYGDEYLGNITLRRALQMSRNVCTVRVLDKIGLDPVFELAGPSLRIGYPEPSCSRTHVATDEAELTCKGSITPSAVDGMSWCESCDPTSCPLVLTGQGEQVVQGHKANYQGDLQCLDEPSTLDGNSWCHSCDVNLRVCDWLPIEKFPEGDHCTDPRRDEAGQVLCRTCDLSMGLGSSSLTMVELARAYSAFATYGHLVEPHWINRVRDRDDTVIEEWTPPVGGWPQVMDPAVAGIGHWLLREVATGGTAAKSNRLGIEVAGKTGTTNDFFDAWFVGYSAKIVAAAWVGYDKPRSIGISFTGGDTALPIWMQYMEVAAPKGHAGTFPPLPGVEFVSIDESTGEAAAGGRSVPMLPGTAPANNGAVIGQKSTEELLTGGF
jgi:penicillin-binding protein 1A